MCCFLVNNCINVQAGSAGCASFARSIRDVFQSLAAISIAFAENGPGFMPRAANLAVERHYIKYREEYNSSSVKHWCIFCGNWSGFLYLVASCVPWHRGCIHGSHPYFSEDWPWGPSVLDSWDFLLGRKCTCLSIWCLELFWRMYHFEKCWLARVKDLTGFNFQASFRNSMFSSSKDFWQHPPARGQPKILSMYAGWRSYQKSALFKKKLRRFFLVELTGGQHICAGKWW